LCGPAREGLWGPATGGLCPARDRLQGPVKDIEVVGTRSISPGGGGLGLYVLYFCTCWANWDRYYLHGFLIYSFKFNKNMDAYQ